MCVQSFSFFEKNYKGESTLITPSIGNIHCISYSSASSRSALINLQYLFNKYVDWNANDIQFCSIPESILDWIKTEWQSHRMDEMLIKDEEFVHQLLKKDFSKFEMKCNESLQKYESVPVSNNNIH